MVERIDRRGKSIRELVEKTGISRATIVRWTSRPREEYLAQANFRAKKAKELRAEGKTIREIAAELKMSVGGVHSALHR